MFFFIAGLFTGAGGYAAYTNGPPDQGTLLNYVLGNPSWGNSFQKGSGQGNDAQVAELSKLVSPCFFVPRHYALLTLESTWNSSSLGGDSRCYTIVLELLTLIWKQIIIQLHSDAHGGFLQERNVQELTSLNHFLPSIVSLQGICFSLDDIVS